MIQLISYTVTDFKLGVQEIQRMIVYQQLKSILLIAGCPFMIKRNYLIIIYQLYINEINSSIQTNLTLDNDEIADLISRVIVPDFEQKQMLRYLEGFISPRNNQMQSKRQYLKD